MKNKFILLLLFCFNGAVTAADADSFRERAIAFVADQLKIMHQDMKKYCLGLGMIRYRELIDQGYSEEAARIKVCYECSQEGFEQAVSRVKITLLVAKLETREQLLNSLELVPEGIRKVLEQNKP